MTVDPDLETEVALALAHLYDDPPSPRPACPSCGHALSDHRPGFGCIEPLLGPDGEAWEGCPCDVGAGVGRGSS